MRRLAVLAIMAVVGCEGPPGPRGLPGRDSPEQDSGSAPVDAEVEEPPEPEDAASTEDADDASDASEALTGTVRDPSGPVARGSVVLISKERVSALARQPLDLTPPSAAFAANDEPLEDALKGAPDSPRAPLSEDGAFRFDAVPDGDYFVVFTPASDDSLHLPGGHLARTPFAADALRGAMLELRVSGAPSAQARYVGSESCTNCHGRHGVFASSHSLSLRIPGLSTPQQDVRGAPRIDEALAAFDQGTTLYYYDCQAPAADSLCAVSSRAPAAPAEVPLTLRLGRDDTLAADRPGHYFVELAAGANPPQRFPVALTLGGTRSLQQYVARVARPGGGFTHFVLPLSYQLAGDDARPSFADFRWVSYRVSDWLDLASGALHAPAAARAFERECVGCHSTGFQAKGDDTRGYGGSAVASAQGNYDLDGDGRKELLAVGCEACHGPGSEHIESARRGQRIVSPSLLTAERSSMLCGSCHGRYRGKHGEGAPLDDAFAMPRAGLSRSEFLARHVSALELGAEAVFSAGDSRLSYAQYADFVRSSKYRSAELQVSCSDCHDSHRTQGFASDLTEADGNQACTVCHRAQREVLQHVAAEIRFPHNVGVAATQLTCLTCHMVKTGRAGARLPALRDVTDPDPSRHQAYYHGDRSNHRFTFTDRSHAAEQPVAITQGCAPCHGELLP